MALWTQSLNIHWQPEIKYFERWTHFLRELEEHDLLVAFRSRGNALDVRIGDYEFLTIGVSRARLDILSPSSGGLGIRTAARTALNIFEPKNAVMYPMHLRYLLPVDQDAETAQIRTSHLVAGEMGDSARDWALLVDGHSSELRADYQVEYGIVSAGEMEDRLSGRTTRVNEGKNEVEQKIDIDGLPRCGVFLDVHWHFEQTLDNESIYDQAESIWKEAVEKGEEMANRIAVRLDADGGKGNSKGAKA